MFSFAIDSTAQFNKHNFARISYEFRCEFDSQSKTSLSLQLIEMYAHENYVRFDFQNKYKSDSKDLCHNSKTFVSEHRQLVINARFFRLERMSRR
jgi:hypothetical protein